MQASVRGNYAQYYDYGAVVDSPATRYFQQHYQHLGDADSINNNNNINEDTSIDILPQLVQQQLANNDQQPPSLLFHQHPQAQRQSHQHQHQHQHHHQQQPPPIAAFERLQFTEAACCGPNESQQQQHHHKHQDELIVFDQQDQQQSQFHLLSLQTQDQTPISGAAANAITNSGQDNLYNVHQPLVDYEQNLHQHQLTSTTATVATESLYYEPISGFSSANCQPPIEACTDSGPKTFAQSQAHVYSANNQEPDTENGCISSYVHFQQPYDDRHQHQSGSSLVQLPANSSTPSYLQSEQIAGQVYQSLSTSPSMCSDGLNVITYEQLGVCFNADDKLTIKGNPEGESHRAGVEKCPPFESEHQETDKRQSFLASPSNSWCATEISGSSEDSSDSSSEESFNSTLTRDERKAREANIPMSYHEIVNLSIDQFNEQLARHKLTESQLTLIKDIRRRGKNKVAAQSCRKRKMEQIYGLQQEVNYLANKRRGLSLERCQLVKEHENLVREYDRLQSIVQERMRQRQHLQSADNSFYLDNKHDG